jgi:hypothetical protein
MYDACPPITALANSRKVRCSAVVFVKNNYLYCCIITFFRDFFDSLKMKQYFIILLMVVEIVSAYYEVV